MAENEGMRLEDYVSETLLAIVGGVLKAQEDERCGAYVGRTPVASGQLEISTDRHDNTVSLVKFDLATTVDEKRSGAGSAGIKVLPFVNVSGEGKGETASSLVSRIAFSVSIAIPMPHGQKSDDAARDQRRRANIARSSQRLAHSGRI